MKKNYFKPYALEIRNLIKKYGEIYALKEINLKVSNGDFYALLGPNGAGKTTVIGIITSLINKSSGNIKIFGYDLQKNVIEAKSLLGLVPQEFNFNPFENVLQIITNQAGYYGINKREAMKKAEKYLNELDLWNDRYQTARMLSGGMKRRLMIIRALIHSPKLLILDEPSAGVDIQLRILMWNFLKKLNHSGTTIILTTHYLEEAEILCRNIGIIQKGILIENTSMKDLLAKLKTETFILDLDKNGPIPPKLIGYQSQFIDNYTLEVDIYQNQGLNDLFSQLNNKGVKVLSMRNKANKLETLFVKLIKESKEVSK
ncbi:MAG: ABC transporter ATP-binding protein [Candidatus Dasytiphilus stammeri]